MFIFKYVSGNGKAAEIYSGTAEADKINIASEVSGKIKEIKVQEGSKIKAGDLVAVLDSQEGSIRLEDADISIKNAENEIGKLEDGNRKEEIKAQQALVEQGKASINQGEAALEAAKNSMSNIQNNLNYKKKIYEDTLKLNESGAESKYKVDAAKNEVDNLEASLKNQGAAVESAEAQVNNNKAQLTVAIEKLNLLVNGAKERDKTTAEYGLEKAKKDYELSKISIEKSNIKSDVEGILETVNFKKGEFVNAGTPVATLIDNKNIWVKVYVPENILSNLSLGKEVKIKSDFLKDKTIKGKIVYISPEAEFTPMNIVTKKDRVKLVYAVKVKITDNINSIKPGMLLDVDLK